PRGRCWPADTRRSLGRGVGRAVAAALLAGRSGGRLVPLIRAGFAGGALLHGGAARFARALGEARLRFAEALGGSLAGGA
ncbi:ABC transporter ATP-binding protein, partial [Burkholderia pseudomallei]